MSGLVDGRPGRRACEPSYFWATSLRYQRRIVSGVTIPDTSARRRRPRTMPFTGQAAALVVGEAQPSGSVRGAEDSVLLEQVVDDGLLLPVNPARDQQEQEGERARRRVPGGSVSQRGDLVQGGQANSGWSTICGTSLPAGYSHSTGGDGAPRDAAVPLISGARVAPRHPVEGSPATETRSRGGRTKAADTRRVSATFRPLARRRYAAS